MSKITMTREESTVLIELLHGAIAELRMEITDTDKSSFREMLKARKYTLERIREKLLVNEPRMKAD